MVFPGDHARDPHPPRHQSGSPGGGRALHAGPAALWRLAYGPWRIRGWPWLEQWLAKQKAIEHGHL